MEHAPHYITPDGTDDTFKWLQAVNLRNEIDQLDLDRDGPTYQIQTQYDAAGNLTFDGTYFYQYDAWNRLIQINEASWNTGTSSVDIGLIVKHYTYDGHGRLIRIQSPYPDPWTAQGGDFRTERLYYDGIRRIQEVIVDPVTGESGGGEEAEGEDDQIGGGQAVEYLSREYVWGPGDQGFDELLVQYNGLGDEFWAIMDAGGDLVALCDLGGSGGAARVVGQWTYDAYGAVLSADHLHAMAHPHLGHKGLFVDRLDAGIVTDIGGPESPRLVPFADANYYVRNRSYQPGLGRWLQRDPNCTAQQLLSHRCLGEQQYVNLPAFDVEALFRDGPNLYGYLGGNPWSALDELGLFRGVGIGLELGFSLGSMSAEIIGQYAFNQVADVNWAADWQASDNAHTRNSSEWIAVVIEEWREQEALSYLGVDLVRAPLDALEQFARGLKIPKRLPFRRTIKHGGDLHRLIMFTGVKRLRGFAVRRQNMRLNQALVDPLTQTKLSNKRPDVQGFVPPNTIHIVEAVVSQSVNEARSKWRKLAQDLRKQGYNIVVHVMDEADLQDFGL